MSASLFDIFRDESTVCEEKKYYVYATDRKDFYLDEIYATNDRKRLVETIKRMGAGLSHKKWAKKHLGDDNVVELTVTNGECNWHGDVNLTIDTNKHEVYLIEKPSQKMKPWNGKIVFHRK